MILGVDIGGTKTHLIVARRDEPGREYVVPTRDWWRTGAVSDAEVVADLWQLLIGHVAIDEDAVIVIGAHGCETRRQCDAVAAALRSYHRGRIHVTNDAQLVVPAAGHDHGIGLVVGTGSIVVGMDRAGQLLRSGGHGWQLGDPGSAVRLVREAAHRVLVARDEGIPRDALATRLMASFGVADEIDLINVFAHGVEVRQEASVAEEVFAAAEEGSVIALDVVRQQAGELAHDISRLRRQGAVGAHVVCAGGVITHNPLLRSEVEKRTNALEPDLVFTVLTVPPVHGAVRIGRQLLTGSAAGTSAT